MTWNLLLFFLERHATFLSLEEKLKNTIHLRNNFLIYTHGLNCGTKLVGMSKSGKALVERLLCTIKHPVVIAKSMASHIHLGLVARGKGSI